MHDRCSSSSSSAGIILSTNKKEKKRWNLELTNKTQASAITTKEKTRSIMAANLKTGGDLSSETPSSPAKSKPSCLCAPTNHPGSFRCRRHRNSASVGSNLCDLGNRRTASVGANLHQLGEDHDTNTTKRPSREC